MDERIKAVQRMQDYIEEHLEETITLGKLAEVSLYSPWYSYRLFHQYLNTTPADYIRRLRLSKSALKLRDEQVKITDVAFEFGFNSVDGYQRAFFREFNSNPKEYAANPIPIYLFTPYGIRYSVEREEKTMEQVWSAMGYAPDDSNPRIQLEPIGARGYVELLPVKKNA